MKKTIIITIAAATGLLFAPATANAIPVGAEKVTPNKAACLLQTPESNLECGAALALSFLKSQKSDYVVNDTATINSFFGTVTLGLNALSSCDVNKPVYYCDQTIIVKNPPANNSAAAAAIIQASAEGIQQGEELERVIDRKKVKGREASAACWAGVGINYLIQEKELPATAEKEAAQQIRNPGFNKGFNKGPQACNDIAKVNYFN